MTIYTTHVPPGLVRAGMASVTWEDDLPGPPVLMDHFEPCLRRAWENGDLERVSWTYTLRRLLGMPLDGVVRNSVDEPVNAP